MRRRLLRSMLLIAALAVVAFGAPLALSVQALYRNEALLTLSEEAARAVAAVPASFARDKDLPELPDPGDGTTVGLYDAGGRRLKGSGPAHADAGVAAALRGGKVQRSRENLVVTVPIVDREKVIGAVRASISSDVVASRTRRTWALMAALAFGVLIAAGLVAARRSRHLTRPLVALRADADVIGAGGEVTVRPATGVDEIDAVHTALAQAATGLNASLARERSFSADLAHQLRTPLASLRLRLETEQLRDGHDTRLLDDALRDVDRLQQTIDDLLELARDQDRAREPHALAPMLRDAATHWTPRLTTVGRGLDLDVEAHLPWVDASPAAIRQILDVLIDNALIHGDGTVTLSGSRKGQGVVLAVADQGHSPVDADEIFVRRHRGAAGSGIGLALARRLAEAEDTRLVLAYPGPGVVFHLIFGGRGAVRDRERSRPHG